MKKTACAFTSLLLLSLWITSFAYSDEYFLRAKVSAGDSDRIDTPVVVEAAVLKDLRKLVVSEGPIPAIISVEGRGAEEGFLPAQVEPLDKEKVSICWIVPRLEAGKERTYQIHVAPAIRGELKKLGEFSWQDSSKAPVRSTDLFFGHRPVLRYMWTPFDKQDIELTKKPFHHVFSPDGRHLITKGPGGLYPHHRGIYFGYNRCKFGGQSCDTWHAHKGEHEVHVRVLKTVTGPVVGGQTVEIHWNDREGKTFVEETRRLQVFRQSKGRSLIEFTSELRTKAGPVRLDGDRQHAGVQFRAAQAVAENQKATRYLRPAKWADLPADKEINTAEHRDLPWNALQFPMEGKTYTVAYLSDPKNPGNADFSERLYGRFGEFIPWDLSEGNPLSVRYRFWIDATGKVTREDVARRYEDLATPPKVVILK